MIHTEYVFRQLADGFGALGMVDESSALAG
jgi:hypothetical protein